MAILMTAAKFLDRECVSATVYLVDLPQSRPQGQGL